MIDPSQYSYSEISQVVTFTDGQLTVDHDIDNS